MGGGEAVSVVAGIGCRAGTPSEAIIAVVRDACARAGRDPATLAAPAFKAAEAGLVQAAQRLGMTLHWVSGADLAAAQPSCVTLSAAAGRATGVASVAEGCALAAAGPHATLLLPRIAHAAATCALAESRA